MNPMSVKSPRARAPDKGSFPLDHSGILVGVGILE